MWGPLILQIAVWCMDMNWTSKQNCQINTLNCVIKKTQTIPQGNKDDFLLECILRKEKK